VRGSKPAYTGGAARPSSANLAASPCMGRVFVSVDISIRRFLRNVRASPSVANPSVLGGGGEG